MQDVGKYIGDFCNISTYRHFPTTNPIKITGINPAISYYLRNSAPNFSSTAVNTRLCASVTSSSVNVRSGSEVVHRECK